MQTLQILQALHLKMSDHPLDGEEHLVLGQHHEGRDLQDDLDHLEGHQDEGHPLEVIE